MLKNDAFWNKGDNVIEKGDERSPMKSNDLYKLCIFTLGILFLPTSLSYCADWPCYRGDAARSAISAEKLAFPLEALWVYRSIGVSRPELLVE